jgi:pre-mRNA-splicing factor SPF27
MAVQKDAAPLALEYHGKATAQGHWRKNQELVDALAYIDPLTPDVKQQVDKLIEEEMRRSTLRPQDYLNKLPAMPPAKFEGHPLLQQEYQRSVQAAARLALAVYPIYIISSCRCH